MKFDIRKLIFALVLILILFITSFKDVEEIEDEVFLVYTSTDSSLDLGTKIYRMSDNHFEYSFFIPLQDGYETAENGDKLLTSFSTNSFAIINLSEKNMK